MHRNPVQDFGITNTSELECGSPIPLIPNESGDGGQSESLIDRSDSTNTSIATDNNGGGETNKQDDNSAEDTTPRDRAPHQNTHSHTITQPGINGMHPDTPQGKLLRRNSQVQTPTHSTTRTTNHLARLQGPAIHQRGQNEFNTPLLNTLDAVAGAADNITFSHDERNDLWTEQQGFTQDSSGLVDYSSRSEAPSLERQALDGDSSVPSRLTDSTPRAGTLAEEKNQAHSSYERDPVPRKRTPWDARPFFQFSENLISTAVRPPSEQPYYGCGPLFASSKTKTNSADAHKPKDDEKDKCVHSCRYHCPEHEATISSCRQQPPRHDDPDKVELRRCHLHCFDPAATNNPHRPQQTQANNDEEKECPPICPYHCPDPDAVSPYRPAQPLRNFDSANDSPPRAPPSGSSRGRLAPGGRGYGGRTQPNRNEQLEHQQSISEAPRAAVTNLDPIHHIPLFHPTSAAQRTSQVLQTNILGPQDHIALENNPHAANRLRIARPVESPVPYRSGFSYSTPPRYGEGTHPSPAHYNPPIQGYGASAAGRRGVGMGTDGLRPEARPFHPLRAPTHAGRYQFAEDRATQRPAFRRQRNLNSGDDRGGLGSRLRATEAEMRGFCDFDLAARRDDPFGEVLYPPSPQYRQLGEQPFWGQAPGAGYGR